MPQPTGNFQELAVNLARAILSAVGAAPEAISPTPGAGAPAVVATPPGSGPQALHQEFKVVIDGIKLPADVAAGINQAIQKAVLQEIAGMDTQGDFSVSRPLVGALSADGGGGGNGGGVAVKFTSAVSRT